MRDTLPVSPIIINESRSPILLATWNYNRARRANRTFRELSVPRHPFNVAVSSIGPLRSGYNIGPTPMPGQHTQEILTEILGMTDEDLRQRKEELVLRQ